MVSKVHNSAIVKTITHEKFMENEEAESAENAAKHFALKP